MIEKQQEEVADETKMSVPKVLPTNIRECEEDLNDIFPGEGNKPFY